MATLGILAAPIAMTEKHAGLKRRYRSISPGPTVYQELPPSISEPTIDCRPRKTRRLQERSFVVTALPDFRNPIGEYEYNEVDTIYANGPISPATFSQAMNDVLMQRDEGGFALPKGTGTPGELSANLFLGSHPTTAISTKTDFWFPTGDLVLGVENLMFRVHKQALSQHSMVFKDMFALSEPSTGSDCDNVENVPRVQLYDSASDWIQTLSWIYTGSPSYHDQTVPFNIIKAHLILSNKYDMPILRDLSEGALRRIYPTNPFWPFTNPIQADPSPVVHAPEALVLAHQCDVPKVLPAAMYHLLTSHDLSSSKPFLPSMNLDRGLAALRSVANSLSTTLSISPCMLPPEFLPGGLRPLSSIYESNLHMSCQELIEERWHAILKDHWTRQNTGPDLLSNNPAVPLFNALSELHRTVFENDDAEGDSICRSCNWIEGTVMQRTIAAIITALPKWFGLS